MRYLDFLFGFLSITPPSINFNSMMAITPTKISPSNLSKGLSPQLPMASQFIQPPTIIAATHRTIALRQILVDVLILGFLNFIGLSQISTRQNGNAADC
jgi:hypothetical protein